MALRANDLAAGLTRRVVVVEDLTRTQLVQYAGASGDFNPLHTDEVYAIHAGYPSVFAHGMLTMAVTGRMLTDWVGDGRLLRFGVRFASQVWPGDALTATAVVESVEPERSGQWVVKLAVTTTNQRDEKVLSGYAEARVDP